MKSSRTGDEYIPLSPAASELRATKPTKLCTKTTLWGLVVVTVAIIVAFIIVYIVARQRDKTMEDFQKDFLDTVSAVRIRDFLQYYTSQSHIAGSIRDYATANYTRNQMLSFGIPEVVIEEYKVLLSYPSFRGLQIVSPLESFWVASLQEQSYSQDPTSSLPSIPTYLGYSASGNVTSQVIYANYGRHEDFASLAAQGINVSGKIVIIRYGQIFRGNKVSEAEAAGAIGVLLYSDPINDGYRRGPTYPTGPWKPETGVQRGSVWNGNGDPLTPGWPSTQDAPRIPLEDAFYPNSSFGTPLPSIPALPISWGDAYRILAGFNTTNFVPNDWEGGLNISYSYGPSLVEVNLVINMDYNVTSIWNVIGKIPGSIEPDRYVLVGNHRDAWTFGAVDPSSGSSVLLETAHGLGDLIKQGWKPRRSVWLCSWDAEEFALIGSVEFVESHFKELLNRAVVYINVDTAVSGGDYLYIEGVPSLAELTRQVAALVPAPYPKAGVDTLYDLWKVGQNYADPPILTAAGMGTGSDYGAFLHHAGIPSIDLGMVSKDSISSGVYHTQYDSFYWMTQFADPNFFNHAAVTKLVGILALSIADTALLPFTFTEYSTLLNNEIVDLKETPGGNVLDWTPLNTAVNHLSDVALQINMERADETVLRDINALKLRCLNDRLFQAERGFLYFQGIPGREWYRHIVWVTSIYNSYGSSAFGTIGDALVSNNSVEAQKQVDLVSIFVQQTVDYLALPPSFS